MGVKNCYRNNNEHSKAVSNEAASHARTRIDFEVRSNLSRNIFKSSTLSCVPKKSFNNANRCLLAFKPGNLADVARYANQNHITGTLRGQINKIVIRKFSLQDEITGNEHCLEALKGKGNQALLKMVVDCTSQSALLFNKLCSFLLSSQTVFQLSGEMFREIVKAHRRVYNDPPATFAFFHQLHRIYADVNIPDSLLVFLVNYAIENRLPFKALEIMEFYWQRNKTDLMQFTKATYKLFRYFKSTRNRIEVDALCTKIVRYFERFPEQKMPIQLATILLTQYSEMLCVLGKQEIQHLLACIPQNTMDLKFKCQLFKAYCKTGAMEDVEMLIERNPRLLSYLAEYQEKILDESLSAMYGKICPIKFLSYLERTAMSDKKLKELSWRIGYSAINLFDCFNSEVEISKWKTILHTIMEKQAFLQGIIDSVHPSTKIVEQKLNIIYKNKSTADILECVLVEKITKKYKSEFSITPIENDSLALFNSVRDSTEAANNVFVCKQSLENHQIAMEAILSGTNPLAKLKNYLTLNSGTCYQYWSDELTSLVLDDTEGWEFILNPSLSWTISDEFQLKLARALLKYHPLSASAFENGIKQLFLQSNGSNYLYLLAEIVEICLKRYRMSSIVENILFFVLGKFQNFSFFVPFFKLVNWYDGHKEREKTIQLLETLKSYGNQNNPLVAYIQLILGIPTTNDNFFAKYYYLLHNGFTEKAWNVFQTSFPSSQSRNSYLNVYYECGKFDLYLEAAMKHSHKLNLEKICFASTMANQIEKIEGLQLSDSCYEQVIMASLERGDFQTALSYADKCSNLSLEIKEELFCMSVICCEHNSTRKFIDKWEMNEYSPRMQKYLIKFCCQKKNMPFAYEVASLFFSKYGIAIDYSVSIVNMLSVYSTANVLLSHFFPLMTLHSIPIPSLAYHKMLRFYIQSMDEERVSHYLNLMNQSEYLIHPRLLEAILDSSMSIPLNILHRSFEILQASSTHLSERLRSLLIKNMLSVQQNYEKCHEIVFSSPDSTTELFDLLLEFHSIHFSTGTSVTVALDIFEEICLRNVEYSNDTINYLLNIFAKDNGIENIEAIMAIVDVESEPPIQLFPSTVDAIIKAYLLEGRLEKAKKIATAHCDIQLSTELEYLFAQQANTVDNVNCKPLEGIDELTTINLISMNTKDRQTTLFSHVDSENAKNNLDQDATLSNPVKYSLQIESPQIIEDIFDKHPTKRHQLVNFHIKHSLKPSENIIQWVFSKLSAEGLDQFRDLLDYWGLKYESEQNKIQEKSPAEEIEWLSKERELKSDCH